MTAAGEHIGPYVLTEPLGTGGMGEVWLAEDPSGASGGTPRRVAVKLLSAGLVGDPGLRLRFAREVEAARRVHGSSVAALLDADLEATQPWLAAEYVAGPSLFDHIAQHGPLGETALRALGAALADALVAIHASGVVHRDLTPRNVVLGPQGPRVVDFGIAWFAEAPTVTQTGTVVGTPAWMAPEQLRDDVATPATDVWAWGAVMAYAARGRPVVVGSRPEVAMNRLLQGELDLADLPPWLDPWARATMAAEPTARPNAMQLREWITGRAATSDETVPELLEQTWVQPTVAAPVPDLATEVLDRAHDAEVERRSTLTALRWGSGLLVVLAALAFGLLAGLLVVVIVTAVLLVAAVFTSLVRDRYPDGRSWNVPPTWSIAVAAPVVLGAGLSTVVGVWGAVAALVVLLVLFFVLGGDLG
jgi:serine/threonine protein kinase